MDRKTTVRYRLIPHLLLIKQGDGHDFPMRKGRTYYPRKSPGTRNLHGQASSGPKNRELVSCRQVHDKEPMPSTDTSLHPLALFCDSKRLRPTDCRRLLFSHHILILADVAENVPRDNIKGSPLSLRGLPTEGKTDKSRRSRAVRLCCG